MSVPPLVLTNEPVLLITPAMVSDVAVLVTPITPVPEARLMLRSIETVEPRYSSTPLLVMMIVPFVPIELFVPALAKVLTASTPLPIVVVPP